MVAAAWPAAMRTFAVSRSAAAVSRSAAAVSRSAAVGCPDRKVRRPAALRATYRAVGPAAAMRAAAVK